MTPETFHAVIEATWPAAETMPQGPWTIRNGQGGGKRVSAATARQPVTAADLPLAEAEMRALGQTPLFLIRNGDLGLDAMLEGYGYDVVDPVNMYAGPIDSIAVPPPHATSFAIWEPLAIQLEIWAEGGIGPARIDVMRRASFPKTSILVRDGQRPAATAFCAMHDGVAMIHALEVRASCRRRGMGRHAVQQAAIWARANGATRMTALCTQANQGSNALFASLGLTPVGQYHYRIKT
jgi:L-amino acid N-acyltransferase YncA